MNYFVFFTILFQFFIVIVLFKNEVKKIKYKDFNWWFRSILMIIFFPITFLGLILCLIRILDYETTI